MYSTFHHEIAKARVADFHEEIQRDVMGRAARKSRGARRRLGTWALDERTCSSARRVLTILSAHA